MSIRSRIIVLALLAAAASACSERKPATPLETFKTYTIAYKQKDLTTVKLLLSDATIKRHEMEAKAMNITVDEIIKRETMFSEDQKTIEFRNEKIEGDRATLEVKDRSGKWQMVPFVFEDGAWKIDKAGYADQIIKDVDDSSQKLDDIIKGVNSPSN